ncbi:MAG: response regulator [Anaerolinea sp.]|nr:response regulator [Anaerolinea sp.]MCC6974186.1 response regulator [Anaerolineae bacterium]CAG1013957.1 Alkaline phosphatase synthesis transcriptional regulatory protein PhoP [Anaerolineae bacterium]
MASFKGIRALIIDDDESSVSVLQYLLASLEIEVDVISDSHWIAEQIETFARPNMVFLDLEMPAINGYQVLNILREMPLFKGIPIVAYTTHISHLNDARSAGFDGFLGKPLDRKSLPGHLEMILKGQGVWVAR